MTDMVAYLGWWARTHGVALALTVILVAVATGHTTVAAVAAVAGFALDLGRRLHAGLTDTEAEVTP